MSDNSNENDGENVTPEQEGAPEGAPEMPPIAGFVVPDQEAHEEEADKAKRFFEKLQKDQQDAAAAAAEEAEEEEAERKKNAQTDTDEQLGADEDDNIPTLTEVADDVPEEADPAMALNAATDELVAPEADEEDEDLAGYKSLQERAKKVARDAAAQQDADYPDGFSTVSQMLRKLYDIEYTSPAFEQRAQSNNYQLIGAHMDPDDETRPFTVGIQLTETFTEVTRAKTVTHAGISAQTAYEMAQIASLNPLIQEKGVALIGTEEDMQLLYQAAKAFNLRVDNEENLPEALKETPASWVDFMKTVPVPNLGSTEETAAPAEEADATAAEEESGYRHDESVGEEAPSEDPQEAAAEEDNAPAETEAAPEETADQDASAEEESDAAIQALQERVENIQKLSDEFNRVGVTTELYEKARDHVLDTQEVSRKKIRDAFGIGAAKASAILKALEFEGIVEKTGANKRIVVASKNTPS